ncbi:MAG: SRPBCC family protein [Flavobacteriaceae bacterium]
MPKMNITKSIHIDAAPEKIFPIINDLSNWNTWSPWVIAEPTATVNVAKDGKYHDWDGDIIGSGNLKIEEETKNKSVVMNLQFLKPWKSKAITTFQLKKTKKGTQVSWTMESSLPFFLFWMKKQMEVFVGMDYDRGLAMLKDLVETGKTNSTLEFKGVQPFHATKYIGIKTSCAFSKIAENMGRDFGAMMPYLMQHHQDKMSGHALSIYHKVDVVKDTVTYTAAHPVSEVPADLPSEYHQGELPEFSAYTIRHTGPYHHIGNAWSAGMMHQRAKKFQPTRKIVPMEVMYNSPMNTAPEDLISEILFPVK